MWTKFWDMHSGGRAKEKWDKIYIEADTDEATVIFYNRFDHNPNNVSCTCCGEDYGINSNESLAQLSGYHRNCATLSGKAALMKTAWANKHYYLEPSEHEEAVARGFTVKPSVYGEYESLEDYCKLKHVLVITKAAIKPKERIGEVPDSESNDWMD